MSYYTWQLCTAPSDSLDYPFLGKRRPNREGSSTCSAIIHWCFIKLIHQCLKQLEAILSQRIWTTNLAAKTSKSCRQHSKTGPFYQLDFSQKTPTSVTLKSSSFMVLTIRQQQLYWKSADCKMVTLIPSLTCHVNFWFERSNGLPFIKHLFTWPSRHKETSTLALWLTGLTLSLLHN